MILLSNILYLPDSSFIQHDSHTAMHFAVMVICASLAATALPSLLTICIWSNLVLW